MPIWEYPRKGRPIAPESLRNALSVPMSAVDTSGRLLSQLDEQAWFQFDEETCRRLGDAVIARVEEAHAELVQERGPFPIERLPRHLRLQHLELGQRTYTALERAIGEHAAD